MKRPTHFLLALLGAILLPGKMAAQEVALEAPDAASLLQEMAKTYAAAASYADENSAIYRNPDGSERLTVRFRVWFARDTGFRVDAESTSPNNSATRREVLWTNGATIRRWASDKPVSTLPRVRLAGSGMFGTYAYHVPTLLEPGYGAGRRLHELTAPKLIGVETIEGVPCYQVRGEWSGDTYEVWLGREDHLVRKIVATYADHTLEEIHRAIKLGEPIPADVFRFAPEEENAPPKR